MIELYQQVALTRDLPEHHLHVGGVATIVDFLPHPTGGETGCILEVFNALGDTLAVIVVELSAVESLRADEILSVRTLQAV